MAGQPSQADADYIAQMDREIAALRQKVGATAAPEPFTPTGGKSEGMSIAEMQQKAAADRLKEARLSQREVEKARAKTAYLAALASQGRDTSSPDSIRAAAKWADSLYPDTGAPAQAPPARPAPFEGLVPSAPPTTQPAGTQPPPSSPPPAAQPPLTGAETLRQESERLKQRIGGQQLENLKSQGTPLGTGQAEVITSSIANIYIPSLSITTTPGSIVPQLADAEGRIGQALSTPSLQARRAAVDAIQRSPGYGKMLSDLRDLEDPSAIQQAMNRLNAGAGARTAIPIIGPALTAYSALTSGADLEQVRVAMRRIRDMVERAAANAAGPTSQPASGVAPTPQPAPVGPPPTSPASVVQEPYWSRLRKAVQGPLL